MTCSSSGTPRGESFRSARSDELSQAVSDLRADVDGLLFPDRFSRIQEDTAPSVSLTVSWLAHEAGVSLSAAEQAVAYLSEGRRAIAQGDFETADQ